MDLDAELAGMDQEQLKEALSQAELQLEDVQEERDFTLGQTGVHIGANELERLRRAWETGRAASAGADGRDQRPSRRAAGGPWPRGLMSVFGRWCA